MKNLQNLLLIVVLIYKIIVKKALINSGFIAIYDINLEEPYQLFSEERQHNHTAKASEQWYNHSPKDSPSKGSSEVTITYLNSNKYTTEEVKNQDFEQLIQFTKDVNDRMVINMIGGGTYQNPTDDVFDPPLKCFLLIRF